MIGLRHIEVFHAVYAAGSVSGAARVLNVSQPSVTKVLKHAETVLGFQLFERRNGRLVATEDAHALFVEVSDINERVQSLRQTTLNMRTGRTGVLKVAAPPSLCLGVLPQAVSAFLETHKGFRFELQTVAHDDMARKLYEREADLIISHGIPAAVPVASRILGRSELVVLWRKGTIGNPPAKFALSDLQDRPFINLKRSGPIGQQLHGEIARQNLVLNEVALASTIYIAAALVRQGVGLAVVDSFTAQAMAGDEMDYRVLDPAITFEIHAINLETRPLSRTATIFVKQLGTLIGKHRRELCAPTDAL